MKTGLGRVKLQVRPMTEEDVPRIVKYFCGNSLEFYARLGVDPEKVPSPETYEKQLQALIDLPAHVAGSYYSIWILNDEPIGHSSLKDIVYGQSGSQHLHIWKDLERGKGYGAIFFCLSALDFFAQFNLKKIICEPKADNPLPNRVLQKIGFPLIGSRVAASSEISVVCPLNTYDVERAIAGQFLEESLKKI